MPLTPEQKHQNKVDKLVLRFMGNYKWRAIGEVARAFQELRRLEEADDNGWVYCVSCDAHGRFDEGFHGGHFVSRSHHLTLLDERNVHAQCENCNRHGDKNGPVTATYRQWMLDNHGQDVIDELEAKKGKPRDFSWTELAELLIEFKAKIKVERNRIGAL